MRAVRAAGARPSLWRGALAWPVGELKHVLPPTIFFFFGSNLILWTKRMILHEYHALLSGPLVATVAALIVGKAVRHEPGAGLMVVLSLALLCASLVMLAREVRIGLTKFDHHG